MLSLDTKDFTVTQLTMNHSLTQIPVTQVLIIDFARVRLVRKLEGHDRVKEVLSRKVRVALSVMDSGCKGIEG